MSPRKSISLHVDFESLQILEEDRLQAIERGILFDARAVPALLTYNGDKFEAEISLKGDLIDHWQKAKMSLKIKLNDGL